MQSVQHASRGPAAGRPPVAGAAYRWVAVGSSDRADPWQAGADATGAALTGPDPRLLVVFCSAAYDPAQVLAGINAASGGVPLIGCSARGEFDGTGPSGGRVIVTAFGGTGFTVSTAAATGAGGTPREAGAAVAECAASVADAPHVALLMLTDGLAADQEEILRGAYGTVGASVPLVGGSASPGPDRRTFHLHADRVLADAVVAAAIGSDAPFGIGVRHGWRKVGDPMIITSSTRGRVHTLDDRPALDMYLDRFGAPRELRDDPVAFDEFARTRPLGIRRRIGEEVRNVSSTEFLADGWLGCSGDVPEGGLVWLMEGDRTSVLDAAGEACAAAVAGLDDREPIGFLAFDCVSRSNLLGTDGTREEVARMADQAGGRPLAGFYSWGEIARNRGINGYHHQTIVVLAVG